MVLGNSFDKWLRTFVACTGGINSKEGYLFRGFIFLRLLHRNFLPSKNPLILMHPWKFLLGTIIINKSFNMASIIAPDIVCQAEQKESFLVFPC